LGSPVHWARDGEDENDACDAESEPPAAVRVGSRELSQPPLIVSMMETTSPEPNALPAFVRQEGHR
jgi:hypothetical protein